MAIRRSLALLTPKLITSAHHANPLSLAGARGVHLIPLSASASLDHASWSLNDAPSLRSVTAEVSGWLSKQGPHASSVLPIEAVWAQDAAEVRLPGMPGCTWGARLGCTRARPVHAIRDPHQHAARFPRPRRPA